MLGLHKKKQVGYPRNEVIRMSCYLIRVFSPDRKPVRSHLIDWIS